MDLVTLAPFLIFPPLANAFLFLRPKPLGDPIHPMYAYNAYPSVSTPTGPTWSTAPRPYVPALSHAPSYQRTHNS